MNEKKDIEQPCVAIAHRLRFMSFKFDHRGGKKGWPDRGFWGPGGVHLFVEFKTPKGVVSHYQRSVFKDFLERGHVVHVIRSVDEFRKLLEVNGHRV